MRERLEKIKNRLKWIIQNLDKKYLTEANYYFSFFEKFLNSNEYSLELVLYGYGDLLTRYLEKYFPYESREVIFDSLYKDFDKKSLKKKLDTIIEISFDNRYFTNIGLTRREFPYKEEDFERSEGDEDFEKGKIREPFVLAIKSEIGEDLPQKISSMLSQAQRIWGVLEDILPYADKEEFGVLISIKFQLDKIIEYLKNLSKQLSSNFLDTGLLQNLVNLARDLDALEEIFELKNNEDKEGDKKDII